MLYLAATVIFVIGGVGVLARASWGNVVLVTAAIFSSVIILVFWDGKFEQLPDKGFVGILINILVVAALFLLERPDAVA